MMEADLLVVLPRFVCVKRNTKQSNHMRIGHMWALLIMLMGISACGLAPNATIPLGEPALLTEQIPNPRAFGDPNAPVKISEFTDFQ